jgi:hypothetical protein
MYICLIDDTNGTPPKKKTSSSEEKTTAAVDFQRYSKIIGMKII